MFSEGYKFQPKNCNKFVKFKPSIKSLSFAKTYFRNCQFQEELDQHCWRKQYPTSSYEPGADLRVGAPGMHPSYFCRNRGGPPFTETGHLTVWVPRHHHSKKCLHPPLLKIPGSASVSTLTWTQETWMVSNYLCGSYDLDRQWPDNRGLETTVKEKLVIIIYFSFFWLMPLPELL